MSALSFWLLLPFLLPGVPLAANVDPAETLYNRSLKLLEQGKLLKARQGFERTLKLLLQRKPPDKRSRYLLDLGQSDVLYHLAKIDWAEKKQQQACLKLHRLLSTIKKLPPDWPTWPINSLLPGRFRDATKQFQRCSKVPSTLRLKLLPPGAKVERLDPQSKQWKPVQTNPLSLYQKKITLRVKAWGYKTRIMRDYPVPRWKNVTETVRLVVRPPESRPASIAATRRVPPPPVPWYRTPWPWVIGGGIVVVAATLAIAIPLATYKSDRVILVVKPEGQ
jgi:hypothetical protein